TDRRPNTATVTHSTGPAVPDATVTATKLETNVDTKTSSPDAGAYRLPYLRLGRYKITVAKPGFRTAVQDNVTLMVAQTLTVDFKLEVGQVTETVTVAAESPLIETSSAETGRYVSKREF